MFHTISFLVFSTCMYENKFQTPCLSTQHLSTKSIFLVRCIIHHNHSHENNSDMIFLHTFVFPLIPIIFFRVLFVSIQKAINNYTMQVTVTFLKLLFLPFPTLTILKYISLVLQDAYGHDCSDCTPTILWKNNGTEAALAQACLWWCTLSITGDDAWLSIWLRWCKLDISVEKVLFKPGIGYMMGISAPGK